MPVTRSERPQQLGLWEEQQRRDQTFGRAKRFVARYYDVHPFETTHPRVQRTLESLTTGFNSDVLIGIDGPLDGRNDIDLSEGILIMTRQPVQKDASTLREEARTISQNAYTQEDIAEILEIYLAFCDTPRDKSTPDLFNYSRLLHHLGQNPDSFFHLPVRRGAKMSRILNLSFYEELAMLSGPERTPIIAGYLRNDYEKLDLAFAKEGLGILRRNQGSAPDIDISYLSNRDLKRYWQFVQALDKQRKKLKLTNAEIALLAKPFVVAATMQGIDTDLRFEDDFVFDEDFPGEVKKTKPDMHMRDMFGDPIVVRLIQESGDFRRFFAETITFDFYHGIRYYFRNYLDNVPEQVLDQVIEEVAARAKVLLKDDSEEMLKLRDQEEGERGDKLKTALGAKTQAEIDFEKSRKSRRR